MAAAPTSLAIEIRALLRGFLPPRDLDVTRSFSYFSSAMERESYNKAFVLRKLHSLSGVVPFGVFLIEHLWTNAHALRGDRSFAAGVADIQSLPALPFIELFGILLPLAFHSVYSVARPLDSREATKPLQHLTGLVALAFVLFHVWELRGQQLFYGLAADSFYDVLAAHLSSTTAGLPLYALAYLAGLAATVFELANGMSGFTLSWGIVTTERARARAGWACGALGVVLFGLGASTVITFATGSRFGLAADAAASGGQCPGPEAK
jgi:succinate dehydrogenase / fumarate reductase, cytochrome b subunit